MDTHRDRARSDRSRERAQRRKKHRDVGDATHSTQRGHGQDDFDHVDYPVERRSRYVDDAYNENYLQEQLADDFEHHNGNNYTPERSHKKKSKRSSSRQPVMDEDNDYVNAPYQPEEEYLRHNDDLAYDDQEYDDEHYDDDRYRGESQENYPEPEGSVFSNSQIFPTPEARDQRSSKLHPHNRRPPPSVDSLSDFGRQSAAGETPRAVGGDERVFWNPEVDVGAGNQPPINEPSPATGLQKFLASFRRFRKPKAPNAKALTEQNVPNSGTSVLARVIMLDGEEISFDIDRNEIGQSLFTRVCQHADIVETDYFGLTYVSNKLRTWFWLDPEKKINKQLRSGEQWLFSFQVKFYPPEPTLLQEDITRYQLALQVRQDIYTGKLPCSWVTQALLGSFMVQAELGDYDEREHGGSTDYLKEFEFVPSPTPQLLQKIAELHKTHVGMKPNQADVKYLETAKRLELYGVDLHPVRDMENVEIYLGVGFHGIVIYRDRLRIGRFAWPKVLRISYKKNNFYLKIRPDNSEPVETIIGFRLLNHHMANRLWKAAVEHHAFFRLKEARFPRGPSAALGSSCNYTGHTFFQYRTMNINRPHPHFDRSLMKRRTASMPMGLNKAGSMHTLNRAHPRDMTVGRTQDTDNLGPGSTQPSLTSSRHAGSTGQLYTNVPRSGKLPQQHAASVTDHTPSYASAQESYVAGSRSHEYVNQHRFSGNGPADHGSVLSGSIMSGYSAKYGQNGPAPVRSSRRPTSPQRQTDRKPAGYGYETPSEVSQPTSHQNEQPLSNKRRPSGGVPALGGIMLTDPMPRRGPPQAKTRSRNEAPQYNAVTEEPDEMVDASLEYDDEEGLDEDGQHVDYPPQHSTNGRYSSHPHPASRLPPTPKDAGRMKTAAPSRSPAKHMPRGRPGRTELML